MMLLALKDAFPGNKAMQSNKKKAPTKLMGAFFFKIKFDLKRFSETESCFYESTADVISPVFFNVEIGRCDSDVVAYSN